MRGKADGYLGAREIFLRSFVPNCLSFELEGLKLLSPFTLFRLCWKPLADGICPKTPVAELIIFTPREKKFHLPSPSLHAGKEKKKPGHLKSLLAQTSCCSYSTRRGREIQEPTVHLRKASSGHIKDKLSHHGSGAGKGDGETPALAPPPPTPDLLSLFPDELTLQGIARSPGPEVVLRSLLLLVR